MQETILLITEYSRDDKDSHFSKLHEHFPAQNIVYVNASDALASVNNKEVIITAAVVALGTQDTQKYLGLVSALRAINPELLLILLLQYGEEAIAQKALRMGVHDFLIKPVTMDKLRLTLQHAITIRHMRRYIDRLERHISTQSDISPEEKNSIILSQMHSFLVDEKGDVKPLHILEQEIIRSVLKYSNGCVSRAARSLGIGRSTLYRKVDILQGHGRHMARATQMTRPMMNISSSERSSGE